jgi:hypothetical protein
VTSDHHLGGTLPQYPRVFVDDDAIVIIDKDRKRIIWDYEADHSKAERIAREIEVELRSILYVRSRLVGLLEEVADELLAMNLPEEKLEDVIDDAFCDINRMLPSLMGQFRCKAKNR